MPAYLEGAEPRLHREHLVTGSIGKYVRMAGRGEPFTHGAEQRVTLCEVERRIVVRAKVLPPAVLLSVVDLEEEADNETGPSDERRVRFAVAAGDAQRRQLAAKVARAERAEEVWWWLLVWRLVLGRRRLIRLRFFGGERGGDGSVGGGGNGVG